MTATQRLICFIKAMGIRIRFCSAKTIRRINPLAEAMWYRGTLLVSRGIPKRVLHLVLAHEIGHFLDAIEMTKRKGRPYVKRQFVRYEKCHKALQKGRRPHTSLLLTARWVEIRADQHAVQMMDWLRIPYSLAAYRRQSARNLENYV